MIVWKEGEKGGQEKGRKGWREGRREKGRKSNTPDFEHLRIYK